MAECYRHRSGSFSSSEDPFAEEDTKSLREKLASLTLETERMPEQNRDRAKTVFGMLMRAGFRRERDEASKFQPCEDDRKFLKEVDPALCRTLRQGSLANFCGILHPVDSVLDQTFGAVQERALDDETIKLSLQRKDSLFHLHRKGTVEDIKEFKDQTRRAVELAREIERMWKKVHPDRVQVQLLDGHGRMLICLIKALMDLGLDPDSVLKLTIFETDRVVHEYHQYVFPECIGKINETIVNKEKAPNNGVIYLNFCSVASGADAEAWKNHFQDQEIGNWVPRCCKENVLKYIWEVIHPPNSCAVMVSLVIKDSGGEGVNKYHPLFKPTLGNYITGLGFLRLLLNDKLFGANLISMRPKHEIKWDPEEPTKPRGLRSGGMGCPFVTLLIRPIPEDDPEQELAKLAHQFEEWKVADLKEDTLQIGAMVRISKRTGEGKIGVIKSRTVAQLEVEVAGIGLIQKWISSCEPYNINKTVGKIKA